MLINNAVPSFWSQPRIIWKEWEEAVEMRWCDVCRRARQILGTNLVERTMTKYNYTPLLFWAFFEPCRFLVSQIFIKFVINNSKYIHCLTTTTDLRIVAQASGCTVSCLPTMASRNNNIRLHNTGPRRRKKRKPQALCHPKYLNLFGHLGLPGAYRVGNAHCIPTWFGCKWSAEGAAKIIALSLEPAPKPYRKHMKE